MMRIRPAVAALAAGVLLVLTGCIGIPSTGGVNDGDEIDFGGDVPTVLLPSGPREGASQADILSDFIQAATNPADDYQTARLFLAPNVRERWKPDAVVSISTAVGSPSALTDTTMKFSYQTAARVDADGRYFEELEAVPAELEFAFTEVDGEWRISDLEDGVVLTFANFRRVFGAHPLYFFDPSFDFLVPDVRWFATTNNLPTRITGALLAGPSAWLGQGVVVSAFPVGTALGAVVIEPSTSTAVVDLSEEARTSTDVDRRRMRQQLSASLTNVSSIGSVDITINDATLQIGDGGAPVAAQPSVNASPLVLQGDQFGFATTANLSTIDGVSEHVAGLGALAGTYSIRTKTAALLSPVGIYRVTADDPVPRVVDARPDLIAPSMDNAGYIFSARSDSLATLQSIDASGNARLLTTSSVADEARVRSMAVSRDGTRLLLYLETDAGPSLVVVGIVRENGVPVALAAEPVVLAVSSATPIDATWVNDRAVASLSGTASSASVTVFPLGGPSEARGFVADAVQLVGGNGEAGLRVRDSALELFKLSGNSWRSAGITASFIATQQPG